MAAKLAASMQGRSQASAARIPKEMTTYINAQLRAACDSAGAAPAGTVMLSYIRRMHSFCSEWQPYLNHVHINAILHGAAQISIAEKKSRSKQPRPPEYDAAVQAFLLSMLRGLQHMMPTVTSRASSSILWSFARLKRNPDDLLPGTVDALGQRFLRDMDTAIGHTHSSLFLACADLKLYPCQGQLLQEVMQHLRTANTSSFATQALANIMHNLARLQLLDPPNDLVVKLSNSFLKKMQLPDPKERPTSQELANVAWSLAKLPSAAPSAQMLTVLCDSFLDQMLSHRSPERPKAQELATFYWDLARFSSITPSVQLLKVLSVSFLEKMQLHSAYDRGPNAQELANVMVSLAKLPSAAASVQLLEVLCDSFLGKMQSRDAHERPIIQGLANFVWALAKLPSARPSLQLLDTLCDSFFKQMQSGSTRQQPNPQELANFCWGLAKLRLARPSPQLLDGLCHLFLDKLQSNTPQKQPKPQEIANFAWALQQLKHSPPTPLAAVMLDRMLQLCQGGGHHPISQEISNFLLACAELRLPITQQTADALLGQLLSKDTMILQDLVNTAWSLAVCGQLQLSTFRQLLDRLQAESVRLESPTSQPSAGMRQLFQALDWLKPASTASLRSHEEWGELQEQLQRLGTRPQPQQTTFASKAMHELLTLLGVNYSLGVGIKGYTITAVIIPNSNEATPILCSCSPVDFFTNESSRWADFSKAVLQVVGI